MAMATSRRPLLSACGLFETCRLVNSSTFASYRGVLAGAVHLGNRNLKKPKTFLRNFHIEHATRRGGLEKALGCACVAARWGEGSGRRKSTCRGGTGRELGRIRLEARTGEETWLTTFSSARGRGAICDKTTKRVQCSKDGRGFRNVSFSDSRATSCTMHGFGGIMSYYFAKLKKNNERFLRSFYAARNAEVDSTSRRSRNLEIYGQNYATNQRVLSEIVRILNANTNFEVIKLGENCHVPLVVRSRGSDLFLGISAKAAKTKDVYGRYCFSQCRKDRNILNVCASLPSLVNNSFRWWLIPGEQLALLKTDKVQISPEGKWAQFEISEAKLPYVVADELTRRIAFQVPLSEWRIPRSLTHQKELKYLSQMTQKVWTPLACDVINPPIGQRSVDVIIDGVCVQNKTSYEHISSRGLRIDIRKQAGRNGFGKSTSQPYTIGDGIDAIIVNVQNQGTLIGLFVFPRREIIARGWFRGNHHVGKVAVHVFPPYLSPKKGHEKKKQWQLEYYLDVSGKVDFSRARMLLDQCKSGTQQNE